MSDLKVAVIGAGDLGQIHARTWVQVPGVKLIAVADPLAERAQALGEELGVAWMSDYREALSQPGINAVSVAVPTCYHRECVEAAIERGCHVICEKPLALTIADGEAMREAAQQAGVKLAVGFCKRFSRQVETLRELVQSGAIGRPVLYRHISGIEVRPKIWIMDKAKGGGPIIDMLCHYVDQWRVIFASEPVRVKAAGVLLSAGSPDLPGVDPQLDTFNVSVEYASGDVGCAMMSWGLPRGVMADMQEDCLGPQGLLKITGRQITQVTRGGESRVYELEEQIHLRQLTAFAEAVRGERPVAASVEDGLIALRVSLAVLQAIETGETIEIRS
jgi:predicted dehydrogenase